MSSYHQPYTDPDVNWYRYHYLRQNEEERRPFNFDKFIEERSRFSKYSDRIETREESVNSNQRFDRYNRDGFRINQEQKTFLGKRPSLLGDHPLSVYDHPQIAPNKFVKVSYNVSPQKRRSRSTPRNSKYEIDNRFKNNTVNKFSSIFNEKRIIQKTDNTIKLTISDNTKQNADNTENSSLSPLRTNTNDKNQTLSQQDDDNKLNSTNSIRLSPDETHRNSTLSNRPSHNHPPKGDQTPMKNFQTVSPPTTQQISLATNQRLFLEGNCNKILLSNTSPFDSDTISSTNPQKLSLSVNNKNSQNLSPSNDNVRLKDYSYSNCSKEENGKNSSNNFDVSSNNNLNLSSCSNGSKKISNYCGESITNLNTKLCPKYINLPVVEWDLNSTGSNDFPPFEGNEVGGDGISLELFYMCKYCKMFMSGNDLGNHLKSKYHYVKYKSFVTNGSVDSSEASDSETESQNQFDRYYDSDKTERDSNSVKNYKLHEPKLNRSKESQLLSNDGPSSKFNNLENTRPNENNEIVYESHFREKDSHRRQSNDSQFSSRKSRLEHWNETKSYNNTQRGSNNSESSRLSNWGRDLQKLRSNRRSESESYDNDKNESQTHSSKSQVQPHSHFSERLS